MAATQSTRVSLPKQFPGEYNSWKSMRSRCYNRSNASYRYYGAKGISVCERWRDSFAAFLEDMGPKPTREHQIEREKNEIGYEPSNCRWATPLEQAQNTSKVNFVEAFGRRQSTAAWARETGLTHSTIRERIAAGESPEEALSRPSSQPRWHEPITIDGRTQSVTAWAKECGITPSTINSRIKDGWDVRRAVTTPKMKPYRPLKSTTARVESSTEMPCLAPNGELF
jgi:hypothetical protein